MVDGRRGEETTPQGCGGDLCKYSEGVEEEPEPEPGRGCRVKSVGVAYMEPAPVGGARLILLFSPFTGDDRYSIVYV